MQHQSLNKQGSLPGNSLRSSDLSSLREKETVTLTLSVQEKASPGEFPSLEFSLLWRCLPQEAHSASLLPEGSLSPPSLNKGRWRRKQKTQKALLGVSSPPNCVCQAHGTRAAPQKGLHPSSCGHGVHLLRLSSGLTFSGVLGAD